MVQGVCTIENLSPCVGFPLCHDGIPLMVKEQNGPASLILSRRGIPSNFMVPLIDMNIWIANQPKVQR